ncbi:MAG: FtsX-like permease family protein [Gammaproteobacteria bacterium]|nr:FtsX-like permease family protein [Gammaproteobacteria bacterium]
MKLISLAWRNVWRRKRRTLITASSIGFGVLLSATFTGMALYMYGNMIDASASTGFGHITISAVGYNKTPTLDKRISTTDELREKLIREQGVADAMVRIMGQAMFASAVKSVGGMFLAIDPSQETEKYNLLIRLIKQGNVFTDKDGTGVVVGNKLAEKLNLKLGKKLVYTTTDVNGEIVSEIARVSGVFSTGVAEIDGGLVLLPIDRVRNVLGYEKDEATLLAVMLDNQRKADDIRHRLSEKLDLKRQEALTWRDTQADLAGMITIDGASNYISQLLVALLISAGVLNTLLMSVLERTREFGVMMALGMSARQLFKLVLFESVWLALIGLVVGVMITSPWYWYLDVYGLDFSAMLSGEDYSVAGVLVDPIVRVKLYIETVVIILSVVFTLAILSGVYPAWRAGRIPPIESLRNI